MPLAEAIKARLEAVCQPGYVMICGSLRRERPFVGYIEIVFAPRFDRPNVSQKTDFFAASPDVDKAEELINQWLAEGKIIKRLNKLNRVAAWGPKNKLATHVKSGIPIDFFSTTIENWFTKIVIRTGGKETNLELTGSANKHGRTLHAYGDGITELMSGRKISARSEEDVFNLCHVRYREPKDRK